ncbi:DUF664 domain-containing protein [Actinomadura coerulea]|uniref:mycothiol transferase n=1 Tax=Actinomadura coerulea TaxID=46159 RepID=UPI0034127DE1
MTTSGVVNQLRWVEYYWFQVVFLGEEDRAPWTEEDPDREMCIVVDFPLTQLLDEYAEQSARYRELVAGNGLDKQARGAVRNVLHVDLRWILLHPTEETARHSGHRDILRQMLDGTTGNQIRRRSRSQSRIKAVETVWLRHRPNMRGPSAARRLPLCSPAGAGQGRQGAQVRQGPADAGPLVESTR